MTTIEQLLPRSMIQPHNYRDSRPGLVLREKVCRMLRPF